MVQLNFHVTVKFSYSFFISFAHFVIGKFSVRILDTHSAASSTSIWKYYCFAEREVVKFSNLETISLVFCLLVPI